MRGVVRGIGDYGNSLGIPTVGGEVYFDECYHVNPLVNAFSAGIVETDKVASAISYGEGNPVFIVGSATGKDGIHGAAFASKDITEDSINDLPAVQVGDPFQEKLLLEATLEAIATGHLIGIQDMGAAGIICSTSEMSAKGEHGMDIYLDKVPTRQQNMKAWEILLSESQERMLLVVKRGEEQAILDIFKKWDLNCVQIGTVTKRQTLRFYYEGESNLVAEVPAHDLVLGGGAPVYHREYKEPAYFAKLQDFNPQSIEQPKSYAEVARFLLSHPNIASRRWIYEQYDSMVGTANANTHEPASAAVVRVKEGTDKALAMTVDCNGRYVFANPEEGCAIAVAEAARNIACAGGHPIAITNNLNFGNPYIPEVYWQFVGAIKGMSKACLAFDTPVTGGNVSFYNQSTPKTNSGGVESAVFPTPTIGMIGVLDNYKDRMTLHFKNEGDAIYLLGKVTDDINCSEYLYSYHKVKRSPAPYFNLEEELTLHKALKAAMKGKLISSANDVSDGGLFVTLAECAISGKLGFDIETNKAIRKDAFLFGEGQGRIVVSIAAGKKADFKKAVEATGTPYQLLGKVMRAGFTVDDEELISTQEATQLHSESLGKYF